MPGRITVKAISRPRSKSAAIDGMESNAITRLERNGSGRRSVVRLERRAADQMPSARRLAGIDAGLARRYRDRTRRHPGSRRRPAWKRQPRIDARHIRKSRHEPDHVDAIRDAAVQRDRRPLPSPRANAATVGQIGPAFAAVADGHVDQRTSGLGRRRRRLARSARRAPRASAASCVKRIEVDGHRAVPDDDVADAVGALLVDGARERDRAAVDGRIDSLAGSSTQHRRVAGRATIADLIASTAARLERREELLMNVVEAAIRHHDDQVATARVSARRCGRSPAMSGM